MCYRKRLFSNCYQKKRWNDCRITSICTMHYSRHTSNMLKAYARTLDAFVHCCKSKIMTISHSTLISICMCHLERIMLRYKELSLSQVSERVT